MGIEAILGLAAAAVTLATYVVKLAVEIKGLISDKKFVDAERLARVAQEAVKAAEYFGVDRGADGEGKRQYAVNAITTAFPELSREAIDGAISAALQTLALGKAAAGKLADK